MNPTILTHAPLTPPSPPPAPHSPPPSVPSTAVPVPAPSRWAEHVLLWAAHRPWLAIAPPLVLVCWIAGQTERAELCTASLA